MAMVTNAKQFREMAFMLPDVFTGKGKLKRIKKALLLFCSGGCVGFAWP